MNEYGTYGYCRLEQSPIVKPNLLTGVGHGHFRPFSREKPKKGAYKAHHKKTVLAKQSRRKNRHK